MMTGDYTKFPLRPDERWTAAPMQQARVLLDHEWNLNLAASARARADEIVDVIGPAGVAAGSPAFQVLNLSDTGPGGTPDLALGAGHMWVGGLEPYAPSPFTYSSQDQVPPLPGKGSALAYLDVFPEHVQPAEDPAELVDPALAPIDSAARARVGWRVRVAPTQAATCADGLAGLNLAAISDATASIWRAGPPAPADPCAPPGDPLGDLPDGLFRLEVLDSGTPGSALLAWAFDDGASAVAVASFAANQVTLGPSLSVKFAVNDLVEVSWLARREDRLDHGSLYTVTNVAPGAGGDVLTLDQLVRAPASAAGLCVRRWDGQAVGASVAQTAALRGNDLGVRFQITGGKRLLAGDWWGSRLRQSAADPVEVRTDAAPDGIRHAFCPLALVDLAVVGPVTDDCRPPFGTLVGRRDGNGVCTVTVKPSEDLQAAFDALPPGGGEVCLAAGLFPRATPVVVTQRQRIVLTGVGPASVVRAIRHEAAIIFDRCTEVEVRSVRVEGGAVNSPGDKHLNGALSFLGCTDVRVADSTLTCPTAQAKAQTCLTVRAADDGTGPGRIRVEDNDLVVGAWQVGMLIVDAGTVHVANNHVRAAPAPTHTIVPTNRIFLSYAAQVLEAGVVASTAAPTPAVAPAKAPAPPLAAAPPAGPPPAAAPAARGAAAKAPVTPRAAAAAARRAAAGATIKIPELIATAIQAKPGTRVFGLATSFAQFATAPRLEQLGGVPVAAKRFVRSFAGKKLASLPGNERNAFTHLATDISPGLQGIVVAGYQTGQPRQPTTIPQGTVQVIDNLVEGVIQGIHIGASENKPESQKQAVEQLDEVMISRNIIHLSVPYLYRRERHAIFVGNARSTHILDTIATLDRPDAVYITRDTIETPVEAVRVFGQLGPFLVVRHTSTKGFHTGVTVWPLPQSAAAARRVWVVAESMAAGGHAVNLPQPVAAPNAVRDEDNIGDLLPNNVGVAGVPPS
jgi:hypothetical protein